MQVIFEKSFYIHQFNYRTVLGYYKIDYMAYCYSRIKYISQWVPKFLLWTWPITLSCYNHRSTNFYLINKILKVIESPILQEHFSYNNLGHRSNCPIVTTISSWLLIQIYITYSTPTRSRRPGHCWKAIYQKLNCLIQSFFT